MSIFPTRIGLPLAARSSAHLAAAARQRSAPREPGPDDAYDPDQPVRDNSGGPDDRTDPDSYGGGSSDSYSGPDGTYDTPF